MPLEGLGIVEVDQDLNIFALNDIDFIGLVPGVNVAGCEAPRV